MLRATFLTLAVSSLIPFGPPGCPLTTISQDGSPPPTERGTIQTTAQAPESAAIGETVLLEATATAELDGGAISYAWLQTAGAGVQIATADQAVASFAAPSLPYAQILRFMVTTYNEAGAVGRAEASVTIAGDPNYDPLSGAVGGTPVSEGPIARAGMDRSVLPGETVGLDGSRSVGENLTYRWRQITGTPVELTGADIMWATFTAPAYEPGRGNVLEFELVVTDESGRTSSDRVTVTIRDPDTTPQVRVSTSMGDIILELDREKAPITVENFLRYVDEQFYDGTIIHRVVADFVVQGGGYLPGLEEKEPRDPIVSEADNGLSNERGTVAMARMTEPDSATSQFYINLKDNPDLDHSTSSPGYTVFGRVVSGTDVVDSIAEVETELRDGFADVPVEDIVVHSVQRVSSLRTIGKGDESGDQ